MGSRFFFILLLCAVSCKDTIGAISWSTGMPRTKSICEVEPVDETVFTMVVTGGAGKYNYWIGNTASVPFKMCNGSGSDGKSSDGLVCVAEVLNREAVLSYQVNIRAEDVADTSDSLSDTAIFNIQDANDNPPIFSNDPETGIIDMLEGKDSEGATVSTISATDSDNGFSGVVEFSLEGAESSLFLLKEQSSGSEWTLSLVEAVDYEESQIHVVTVVAKDRGDETGGFCGEAISLRSESNIYVNVQDGPDTPPAFLKPQYTARITENQLSFSEEAGMKARDGDYGLGWDVEYSIDGDKSVFDIESSTGKLRVTGTVDRESEEVVGGVYALVVVATEKDPGTSSFPGFPGAQSSNVTVTVVVDDENDNRPKFFDSPAYSDEVFDYMVEIPEDTQNAIPDFRIYIKDIDQDTNAISTLTLTDDELDGGEENFIVSPKTIASQGAVTLQINGNLDYEERTQFKLTIHANEQDGTGTAEAKIVIKVTDVNDNFPIFSQAKFEVHIPEGTSQGTHIGVDVKATDEDDGDFGKVTYSLLPADSFDIYENGTVYVKTDSLDREKLAEYFLTVRAEDGGGLVNTTQLTITLDDINDETPQFQQSQYLVNWNEDDPGLSPVTVSALDLDEAGNDNSKLTLEFENPALAVNYVIASSGGDGSVSGDITPKNALDAENMDGKCSNGIVEYMFRVVVKDHGIPQKIDTANVSVYLRDINDNAPYFGSTSYSGSVAEESPFDTVIVDISAKDDDKCDPNNAVVYTVHGNYSDKFLIGQNDDKTYSLRVKSTQLDRDDIDSYDVVIHAIDSGQPRLTGTATVLVTITDINNKAPIFDAEASDDASDVEENKSIGAVVATVMATDADEDSDLEYSISNAVCTDENEQILSDAPCFSWFNVSTVDQKGEIFVASELDRETVERISLTVKVEDKNAVDGSDQQTSWTMQIRISDYNDNPPEFGLPIPTFTVAEESDEETVIGQLLATDKDSASEDITFSTTNEYVDITPEGQLQVRGRIDREGDPGETFSAIIVANDNGEPGITSTITVNFTVSDTNDHTPSFADSSYICEIEENLPLESNVCIITATDEDIGVNGVVYYSIPNSIFFEANGTTGQITSEAIFNRESTSFYEIKFKAEDDAARGLSRKAEVDVTIRILDVDDNDPTYQGFMPQNMEVVEESEPDTVIGEVEKASDEDTEEFQQNHYFLVYKDESDLSRDAFALDDSTRMLSATKELDREETSSYVLYVLTTKDASIESTIYTEEMEDTVLEVRVSVTDINDNAPEFTQKTYTTDMQVTAQPSETDVVVSVRALDEDSGENAELTYSITEQVYIAPDGVSRQVENFNIEKNGQDGYVYLISPVTGLVGGRYELGLRVVDGGGESDTASVVVKIFDVTETVIIESRLSVDYLNENRVQLEKDLEEALNADVVIDSILPHGSTDDQGQAQSRATNGNQTAITSDIYFHATEWNETTLIPADEITTELDTVENNDFLVEWSIISIASTDPELVEPTSEIDLLKTGLVVAVCLLVVILVVYTTAFICMRRSYKRKLKVSKATEDAARDTLHTYQTNTGDLNIPGTNRHAGGENTLYLEDQKGNLDIQEYQRYQETTDDDNSIDDNEVDSPDSAISADNQGSGANGKDDSLDDVEIDFPDDDAAKLAAALNAAKNRGGEENIIPMFDNPAMDDTAL